jgi:hypothetical protein
MTLSNTTCYKCPAEETHDHVFSCPHTIVTFPSIVKKTKELLEVQLKINKKYENNRNLESFPESFLDRILETLEITSPNFLQNPQARGIASMEAVELLKSTLENIYDLPSVKWIYEQAIGSFTLSFHIKIWMPRTAHVMKESKRNKIAQDNVNDIEPEPPSSTLSSEFPPDSPDHNNNSSDSYRPNHRQPRPNFSMPYAVTTNDSPPVGNHVRANRVPDQHILSQSPALNPRPRPQYHQSSSAISGYSYEHQNSSQSNSRESPSPRMHSPAFHPAQPLLTPKIDQPEPSRKRKQGLKSQDYSTPSKRAKYSEPHTPTNRLPPRSILHRRAPSEEVLNPLSVDCEVLPLATATTREYIGPSTLLEPRPPFLKHLLLLA